MGPVGSRIVAEPLRQLFDQVSLDRPVTTLSMPPRDRARQGARDRDRQPQMRLSTPHRRR
jgi:hypothetical protein